MSSYAEAYARQRNQLLAQQGRTDIEWAIDPTGRPYLRDRFDWSARHRIELERLAEEERERWKRGQQRKDREP